MKRSYKSGSQKREEKQLKADGCRTLDSFFRAGTTGLNSKNESDDNEETATAMLQLDTNTDNESNSGSGSVHPGEILQKEEGNLVTIIDETEATISYKNEIINTNANDEYNLNKLDERKRGTDDSVNNLQLT